MKRLTAPVLLACLIAAACPRPHPARTEPRPSAAVLPSTTAPATKPAPATGPAVDPAAWKVLTDLEQAGRLNRTADVTYTVFDPDLEDTETRTGWVALRKGRAGKSDCFRIHFATLKQNDGPAIRDKVDYAFDGQWLTVAKHRIKHMTRYQVAAKGQDTQVFRLGKGPFPLPFGQPAARMIEHFQAVTRPAVEADPPETVYLKLTTRSKFRKETNFRTLEMWVHAAGNLPVKLVATAADQKVTTVVFANIKTPAKLPDETFLLPRKLGWQLVVKSFKGEA